jgi:hypothetical protein
MQQAHRQTRKLILTMTTTNDTLHDDPKEKARREQSPEEAVEESEAIVENESTQGDDLPPLREPYGGPPDERSTRP